jgi:hypothetical protein
MADQNKLVNHLKSGEDVNRLLRGARTGMRKFLLDLLESDFFHDNEITQALEADSVTITSDNDQLVIKYVVMGKHASETRQFTINRAPE